MEPSMKANLKKMRQMAKVNLFIPMEIDIKETGLTIRPRVLEGTPEKQVAIMKEAGKKTSPMDMESKNGEMETSIKGNSKTDLNKVRGCINGQMVLHTKDNGTREK